MVGSSKLFHQGSGSVIKKHFTKVVTFNSKLEDITENWQIKNEQKECSSA